MSGHPAEGGRTMTGTPATVTLDTNIVSEHWKGQKKACIFERLLALTDSGQIDVAVTTRIEADIFQPPLADRINELPLLGIEKIGTVARYGVSRYGSGDMYARDSDSFGDAKSSICETLRQRGRKGPDWRDWDHIQGHYEAGRDVFLTWDGGMLEITEDLRSRLGVVVMTPEAFLSDATNKASSP